MCAHCALKLAAIQVVQSKLRFRDMEGGIPLMSVGPTSTNCKSRTSVLGPLLPLSALGVQFLATGSNWPISACRHRQQPTDSVEKFGFSARLNSGTAFSGEPTHHIEWFLGPSLTFAALLLG